MVECYNPADDNHQKRINEHSPVRSCKVGRHDKIKQKHENTMKPAQLSENESHHFIENHGTKGRRDGDKPHHKYSVLQLGT